MRRATACRRAPASRPGARAGRLGRRRSHASRRSAGCRGERRSPGGPRGRGGPAGIRGRRRGPLGPAARDAAAGRTGRWWSRGSGSVRAASRTWRPTPRPGSSRPSRRLYGARAGMVDALVLGRRGGIDPSCRMRFARSGLVHLLSISRLPRRAHHRLGLPPAAGSPRLTRSAALVAAAAVERRLRRLPRLARAGDPSGGARRRCSPAAASRQRHVQAERAARGHLPRGAAARSLGHPRSRRVALGRRALGRDHASRAGATARSAAGFWCRTLRHRSGPPWPRRRSRPRVLGTVALVGIAAQLSRRSRSRRSRCPGVLASLLLLPIWSHRRGGAGGRRGSRARTCSSVWRWRGAAVPGRARRDRAGRLAAALPWLVRAGRWRSGSSGTPQHRAARPAGDSGWAGRGRLWLGLRRRLQAFASADGGGRPRVTFSRCGAGGWRRAPDTAVAGGW